MINRTTYNFSFLTLCMRQKYVCVACSPELCLCGLLTKSMFVWPAHQNYVCVACSPEVCLCGLLTKRMCGLLTRSMFVWPAHQPSNTNHLQE